MQPSVPKGIRYEGTAGGLVREALPELRRAAMCGLTLNNDAPAIQDRLQRAEVLDLVSRSRAKATPLDAA